ncbi:MAG TPA: RusA family crossover junction endodeoxyribonuclease [Epulopiscium sp.]|nr:RusA family crossover junction endodeoxyribonuclease [Candidatus Epulonipiscium sp.]
MEHKLIIDGTLPNLNDYLKAERQTFRRGGGFNTKGNLMKQESQELVIWGIRQQLRRVHIDNPVILKYDFYEPNRRRDLDNISAFAHKVVQDALVSAGVLKNDGWKEILGYMDQFYLDKENPRIEVTIKEVAD